MNTQISLNKTEVGEGKADNALETKDNFAQVAVDHWLAVLRDKDATDTAKDSAAKGLAAFDKRREAALSGAISTMSRSDLVKEIARIRTMLG